jgi:transposase-like protein
MTKQQIRARRIGLKEVLEEDRDFLREIVRATLQEVLEAEMTEALGAAPRAPVAPAAAQTDRPRRGRWASGRLAAWVTAPATTAGR